MWSKGYSVLKLFAYELEINLRKTNKTWKIDVDNDRNYFWAVHKFLLTAITMVWEQKRKKKRDRITKTVAEKITNRVTYHKFAYILWIIHKKKTIQTATLQIYSNASKTILESITNKTLTWLTTSCQFSFSINSNTAK